ncbi:MAG: HAMP domain-containing sensor histidine kinase [Myxococcota bacterium]
MARSSDSLPTSSRRAASAFADEGDLRRELEFAAKRIAELEAELARQARVRTQLVHLVAHELRTPITVISGFGRLLLGDEGGRLGDRQRHFVDECLKACRRLDAFVGDLLEADDDSATPLPIESVPADLNATIAGQLESLAPLLAERGLSIERRFDPSLAPFGFDPRRIEQVITNLMTNAIRYGRRCGVVRISTRFEPAADGPVGEGYAVVEVEDDGPGIPEIDRERLFVPYVRGQGRAKSDGLGIGLAICRRIVASHGGTIRAEASALGGACLRFALPVPAIAGREAD